jgi:hypothetical protein
VTDHDHADSAGRAVDGLPPIFAEAKRPLLRELEAALEDRVRVRRARRGGATAAVLALASIGLALLVSHRPMHAPGTQPPIVHVDPVPEPAVVIDPTVIVQLPARRVILELLNDDEVLAELDRDGGTSGLVRTAERVMIVGR